MKICSKCKEELLPAAFNRNNGRKDGLQSYCRTCERERKKKYYESNKDKFYKYNKNRRKKRTEEFREFKKTLSCSKCEDDRWYVLDFHHKDPSKKDFRVSAGIVTGDTSRMHKEIEKCEVLCANCHRELHHKLRWSTG